jgi:DNA-binding PucR family transcriptional regulator
MRLLRVLVILVTMSACASAEPSPTVIAPAAGSATGEVLHPALRLELLTMVEADQQARHRLMAAFQAGSQPDAATVAHLQAVDEANLTRLKQIVQAHGWPDERMVGDDGRSAVFLLVQHADRDVPFQKEYLDWLERAFRAGELPAEAGQDVALLTDRVRTNEGRPQLYGMQVEIQGGQMMVKPIEDEANVDRRRAALGLPPLAEYLAVLRQVYGLPE